MVETFLDFSFCTKQRTGLSAKALGVLEDCVHALLQAGADRFKASWERSQGVKKSLAESIFLKHVFGKAFFRLPKDPGFG